jgi:hypothetical protein
VGLIFQEDRIKTFYCDQLDRSSIRELWSRLDLQAGVDIIIEDGLHTFEANVPFLEESLDHLRPGAFTSAKILCGIASTSGAIELETIYSKQYTTYGFAFVVLPDGGNRANNLLVARRGTD